MATSKKSALRKAPGYRGKLTRTGNSLGLRFDRALFQSHPEFSGEVRAHVIAPGQIGAPEGAWIPRQTDSNRQLSGVAIRSGAVSKPSGIFRRGAGACDRSRTDARSSRATH